MSAADHVPGTDDDAGGPGDVARLRRIDLVDAEGRVRGTLGALDSPDPHLRPVGMQLLDPDGRVRLTAAVGVDGAWITLELDGTSLVHVGVNEPHSDAVDARAFLDLCAPDGAPLRGWRVTDDGELVEHEPPP